MKSLAEHLPRKDGRGIIVGYSGSGKTVLARELLKNVTKLIVVDPKRMFKPLEGMKVYDDPRKLIRAKSTYCVYRPKPSLVDNIEAYNMVYKYAYERGKITVYTDEIAGIMDKNTYPNYLKICYLMGREPGVRMLSTTQRPANIPLFLISECTSFYVFKLSLQPDIKRMSECCPGYDPNKLTSRYVFWYSDFESGDNYPAKVTI